MVHGTIEGYRRHLRKKETPCAACRAIQAARVKRWRQRKKVV